MARSQAVSVSFMPYILFLYFFTVQLLLHTKERLFTKDYQIMTLQNFTFCKIVGFDFIFGKSMSKNARLPKISNLGVIYWHFYALVTHTNPTEANVRRVAFSVVCFSIIAYTRLQRNGFLTTCVTLRYVWPSNASLSASCPGLKTIFFKHILQLLQLLHFLLMALIIFSFSSHKFISYTHL